MTMTMMLTMMITMMIMMMIMMMMRRRRRRRRLINGKSRWHNAWNHLISYIVGAVGAFDSSLSAVYCVSLFRFYGTVGAKWGFFLTGNLGVPYGGWQDARLEPKYMQSGWGFL
jgi:heme A synthase